MYKLLSGLKKSCTGNVYTICSRPTMLISTWPDLGFWGAYGEKMGKVTYKQHQQATAPQSSGESIDSIRPDFWGAGGVGGNV